MAEAAGEITGLLQKVGTGDQQARDQLLRVVYGELRRLAGHYMRQERVDHARRVRPGQARRRPPQGLAGGKCRDRVRRP